MSVYESIMKGLNEAVEYEKGVGKARRVKVTMVAVPQFNAEDIKQLRTGFGLTQVAFASFLGVSKKTVEAWEAGRNNPDGPARRVMGMIKDNPSLMSMYSNIDVK